ncbi:LacI family transcriptional regulator [Rhizobium sp. NTR19]|uniref:LacI family transcriptional regulator n=1 Tax=Neorhizobium turbinariae TaxID=2937795 RepID=A0ABT0IM38_9HYPH|nr:LacI family DNA-binding transcriptional regulator [Neorhizobium turbinariae]MCK8778918.1 LacI family transcriptional regulator [Neorhizobium turbinariae]
MANVRPGANMSAIAAALGVSAATVSNALSGKGRVSPELVQRVRAKAAEVGYVPSLAARALRTGRTGVLGLVLPDISNPLFPQIAQAIENAAANVGYGVLIADSRGDIATQTEAINRLIERGIDGMLIVPRRGTRISDVGCPVAVLDTPSTPGNTVSADHWDGGMQVGRYLASLGHRKVLIIGRSPTSNVQSDRIGGVKCGLGSKVECDTLWSEKVEEIHGPNCMLGLAERAAQGFTAFAALSDLLALRALTELQHAGISVPDMVSVSGFDDSIWSSVVSPSLTTVRQDMATVADLAIAALMRVIEADADADDAAAAKVTSDPDRVPMQLLVRQSTGAPKTAVPGATAFHPHARHPNNSTAGEVKQ